MFKALCGGPIGVSGGLEQDAELAARHGFEGVYVEVASLVELGGEAVARTLAANGLHAAGAPLPVPYADPDEDVFCKSLDELAQARPELAKAAVDRTFTWIMSYSDTSAFDEHFAFLKERFRRIGEVLAEGGIRLGLEFLGPKSVREGHEHEFIHTMDGMLELCAAVGTGNMGLLLDCWHLYTSGGDMDEVLRLTDDHVVNVHINDAPAAVPIDRLRDNVRGLPGESGRIDAARFLKNLERIGYSGPVMVEPFSERVSNMEDEDAVRVTKAAMDSVWPG